MVGVSGAEILALARSVVNEANRALVSGMPANLVAGALMACATDVFRANYKDDEACRTFFKDTVNQRLTKPVEYWGGKMEETSVERR